MNSSWGQGPSPASKQPQYYSSNQKSWNAKNDKLQPTLRSWLNCWEQR